MNENMICSMKKKNTYNILLQVNQNAVLTSWTITRSDFM